MKVCGELEFGKQAKSPERGHVSFLSIVLRVRVEEVWSTRRTWPASVLCLLSTPAIKN